MMSPKKSRKRKFYNLFILFLLLSTLIVALAINM
ncbi:hypothetical protein SAMN05421636_105165 [Pricia antarctica]|uniref:Uncharacterized protein n=1 Tax=Pricia antarctica TaxID=641691 RepID=A0A1G7D5M5_9FLAO|nr:hypothetical protein SAMN05421636_105165 [Pricia antarctica]